MQTSTHRPPSLSPTSADIRARKKFLRFFPQGFLDPHYLAWERDYKWNAHLSWQAALSQPAFLSLLSAHRYAEIAAHAVRIESRTNLLFSFEKMALRDAVKTPSAAKSFSTALYTLLHGNPDAPPQSPPSKPDPHTLSTRFTAWVETLASLPRRQTRVLTWPLATVFAFIAQPTTHFFLKPLVTRRAFSLLNIDFPYQSHPDFPTYAALLSSVRTVRRHLHDLHPRDMIDLQSFLWVQGSDEYD